MVAVVFVAESVPTFGPLLDLVGGSTITLTSVVLPCVFYLFLSAARTKEEQLNIKEPGRASFLEYEFPVYFKEIVLISVFFDIQKKFT